MSECTCPHCGSSLEITVRSSLFGSTLLGISPPGTVADVPGSVIGRGPDITPTLPPGVTPAFQGTRQHVLTRGTPPISFLAELVAWGKTAAGEIFAPNDEADIYSWIKNTLGPWEDDTHRLILDVNRRRRAVMLEVMRVLGGFESSWNWKEGRDTTNATSVTPDTIEAGLWQVSANSLAYGQDLKTLVVTHGVSMLDKGEQFQAAMKSDHPLAMEYIARLLRHTVKHNGPVLRHEIDPWLRRDAVDEFESLLMA